MRILLYVFLSILRLFGSKFYINNIIGKVACADFLYLYLRL